MFFCRLQIPCPYDKSQRDNTSRRKHSITRNTKPLTVNTLPDVIVGEPRFKSQRINILLNFIDNSGNYETKIYELDKYHFYNYIP